MVVCPAPGRREPLYPRPPLRRRPNRGRRQGIGGQRGEEVEPEEQSVIPGQIELNYEVRLRAGDAAFVNTLGELDGVTNVVLVSYNGDYMG